MNWEDAEMKLKGKPDGSFLVRDSSDPRYILSLSFRSQGITHHTRMEHYRGKRCCCLPCCRLWRAFFPLCWSLLLLFGLCVGRFYGSGTTVWEKNLIMLHWMLLWVLVSALEGLLEGVGRKVMVLLKNTFSISLQKRRAWTRLLNRAKPIELSR